MPDDQVTIDPEFQPSSRGTGWSGWVQFGVLAAAAFMLGWLLRSPAPVETEATHPSLSTAPILDTTSTTRLSGTTTTTTTTTVAAVVSFPVPLGEAVPEFTDTITMSVSSGVWGEEVDVLRWHPSQATPETIMSFGPVDLQAFEFPEGSSDGWARFVGLDAAGIWYAVQDAHDMLSVRPVAAIDDEGWWTPTREVVGLRVVGTAWHDTAPGRLAWLSCARAPGGPATLYTLDVADGSAEPVAVVQLSDACDEFGTWFSQWGDWGFALDRMEDWAGEDGRGEPNTWTVLLDNSGLELARLEQGPGGANMVAAGPAGTVWNEEPIDGPAGSFLLSLDGRQRTPVPGIAAGEWVEYAAWSPDGWRIALVVFSPRADRSLIRIVDAATGETTDEIDELGPVVLRTHWSSDGRYLLVGHDRDDYGAAGAALTVYDTVTAAAVIEAPFREAHHFSEIRTFEASSITVQFTPLEWSVGLDEGWGPGVHTIGMRVNAGPLLPEQIEGLSGRLVWNETVVDLCNIGIDDVRGGSVEFGDGFQTIEGCGANPDAMQQAFDQFGLPKLACLVVTTGGVDHEYCAPLN